MSTDFQQMMQRAGEDQQDWKPAPGSHDAIVTEADAFTANAGHVVAKTVLRLVKPGDADNGKEWPHIMSFRTDGAARMSRGQLSLYGIGGDELDSFKSVDDLAAAMAELEGVHVQVTCKADGNGGVWTNVTGSRTGKTDAPVEQGAFSLGDNRGNGPASAITGAPDDDEIPF